MVYTSMQSNLHVNILVRSRPLITFLAGRVVPVRLANPSHWWPRVVKRKRTLWHELLSKQSKSVDSEPTHPLSSRVDFSEQQPFPSLYFVPDRAPVGVAHPYLINENNIDRILYSVRLQRVWCFSHFGHK